VFYQDDSYGQDVLNGMKTALRHLKVHEPEYLATYKRNTIDVQEAASAFLTKKDNIEAIIIIGTYKASAAFTKKMRDGGYKGEIANVSFVGTSALIEEFKTMGSTYAENMLISQVVPYYNSYSERALQFRKAIKKYHPNEKPDFISFEGYIVAILFAEALKRNGRKITTKSFIKALHSIKNYDMGTGQNFSFGKSDHQASHYVWGIKLDKNADIKEITLPVPIKRPSPFTHAIRKKSINCQKLPYLRSCAFKAVKVCGSNEKIYLNRTLSCYRNNRNTS